MPDKANRPSVGFIGLGDQGAPIAQAIADSEFPLLVWARRPESLDALAGRPHTVAGTVAELGADSDVVALCLRRDADNLEVAVDGGLLANMRTGSVLVNHGTGLPAEARRLAEVAAPYGVTVLDAPVSGGQAVALARRLTTIVGGDADAAARVKPIFDTFSKRVIYVGPVGAGQFGKLFNNALMMMNQRSIDEIVQTASALQLPLGPLLEVLRSGSASSVALHAFGPSVTPTNVDHLCELELIDMDLFREAVADLGDRARPVVDRAVAGAKGLPRLTATILASAVPVE